LAYPNGGAVGVGEHDAAACIDHQFSIEGLLAVSDRIWHKHDRLAGMSNALAGVARLDAATVLASRVLEVIR
jgi:hypothetical protein